MKFKDICKLEGGSSGRGRGKTQDKTQPTGGQNATHGGTKRNPRGDKTQPTGGQNAKGFQARLFAFAR